jgi:hypothetical protein
MSWQDFKNSILLIANNPQSIPNTDVVAETYATAYNTAVKSGGDTVNKIPLKKGNLQSMQTLFKAALDKGVTMKGPYDLVAEMGAGVKSYWNAADMQLIIPITFATNGSENTQVITNKVTNTGIWIEPLKAPTPNTNTSSQPNTTPTPPKPADDYNLRKMLDEAGYAAIKKYEDEAGCVAPKSGKTGLTITDWERVGCVGYNPGMDTQEQTIRERIKNVLGFDVWAKIPPLFRMQIYSFMYNSDSTADSTKNGVIVKGDKSRWIAGLLQAAKNETAQYRASLYNETIRNTQLPLLKTLTTADFQKIYSTYLKVLDEMYKSISDAELKSVATKTQNSEKKNALWLASAYNLTWKDRPSTIEKHYNSSTKTKDSNPIISTQSTTTSTNNTNTLPIKLAALNSGPIPPTNNTELIVDYFIRVATAHLTTIQGVAATKTKIGPGVVNWTGYTIKDTTTTKKFDINEELDAEINRFNAYLKSKGVVEEEEIVDETADEKGDVDAVTYTKYKGGSKQQKNAIASALLTVHKIGKYIDYKQPKYPNGIQNTSVGFDVGLCAQWTYNIAKNYVFYLKGVGAKSDANAYRAGGAANKKGYWTALQYLGYTLDIDTTFETKTPLIAVLSDFEKFNIGDVVVYYGTDGIEIPGHTQIFTGGYGSDYPKAAYGTPSPNRPAKKYLEKGGWDTISNWETDAYNNYGSPMVYRSKKNTSTTWRLLIFRAPSK